MGTLSLIIGGPPQTARPTPTSPKASFLRIRWKFSWESSKAADRAQRMAMEREVLGKPGASSVLDQQLIS